jgi:hypothetical protein
MDIFKNRYLKKYKNSVNKSCIDSVEYILNKNIIWGDALTYKTPIKPYEPLVFTEWSFVSSTMVQRREFVLSELFYKSIKSNNHSNNENFIPMPNKILKLINFLKLKEND